LSALSRCPLQCSTRLLDHHWHLAPLVDLQVDRVQVLVLAEGDARRVAVTQVARESDLAVAVLVDDIRGADLVALTAVRASIPVDHQHAAEDRVADLLLADELTGRLHRELLDHDRVVGTRLLALCAACLQGGVPLDDGRLGADDGVEASDGRKSASWKAKQPSSHMW